MYVWVIFCSSMTFTYNLPECDDKNCFIFVTTEFIRALDFACDKFNIQIYWTKCPFIRTDRRCSRLPKQYGYLCCHTSRVCTGVQSGFVFSDDLAADLMGEIKRSAFRIRAMFFKARHRVAAQSLAEKTGQIFSSRLPPKSGRQCPFLGPADREIDCRG